MYDPDTYVLSPYITSHTYVKLRDKECVILRTKKEEGEKKGLRLTWKWRCCCSSGASHQTEWRSKHLGSWIKGGLIQGWKREATQQKLCAHKDHIAVSSVDSNNKLCAVHLYIQLSIFSKRCRHSIFYSLKELSLFVEIFCICPCQSFVMSAGLCSIFLLFLQVSSHPYSHPYVVCFATFIENY